MDATSVPTSAENKPRRGRPVATITLASPRLIEMTEADFDAAVDALANVLRLDGDITAELLTVFAG